MNALHALRDGRVFSRFSRMNGLIYLGALRQDDEADRVRGFTAHAGQSDLNVAVGSLAGRDVSFVRRSVTHPPFPGEAAPHNHTWLIGSAPHETTDTPHVLVLSHQHSRLVDEATYLHRNRARHVAIDPRIDSLLWVYAWSSDVDSVGAIFDKETTTLMIAHPEYDYEYAPDAVYVYDNTTSVMPQGLNGLMRMTLSLAEAFDAR